MQRMLLVTAIAATLSFGAMQAEVSAAPLDDTFKIEYLYPNKDTLYNDMGTISASNPTTNYYGIFDITLTATGFTISNFSLASYWNNVDPLSEVIFNGLHITDLSGSTLTATLDGALTNMAGLSNANLSVSGNQLWLDWKGKHYDSSTVVAIKVQTQSTPVPGPEAGAGLGAIALAGIGAYVIRRRKAGALAS